MKGSTAATSSLMSALRVSPLGASRPRLPRPSTSLLRPRLFTSTPHRRSALPPVPTESSSSSLESIYSSRYHGQGAKRTVPPWYKSPPLLLLAIMPVFTLGLGVWQMKRLQWKVELIEDLEWKLKKEPLRLPKNINLSVLPSFSYRLVSLSGYFDHSRALMVGPRVKDGVIGANVVVPFIRDEGGGEVLIDRGFVSNDNITEDAEGRWHMKQGEETTPSSHVTLVALLHPISPPNFFTPANDLERNRWYHPDPQAMASYVSSEGKAAVLGPGAPGEDHDDDFTPSAGVAQSVKNMLGGAVGGSDSKEEHHVLPIYLEEVYDGDDFATRLAKGIPIGRSATIELRNQHAVYAVTWLSLSVATTGMFFLMLRRGR